MTDAARARRAICGRERVAQCGHEQTGRISWLVRPADLHREHHG